MASFKAAASLLAITASAFPTIRGFTCHAPASARQLRAANNTFQTLSRESRHAKNAAPTIADDVPSGDDDNESEAVPLSVAESDNTSIRNSILLIAASTDRGQFAKLSQKDAASRLVVDLESNASGIESALKSSAGTWELLYSNTQLFRSSPFFLAGRSTCKTQEQADQYNWFCDMHRAALAISTIGVVRQVITGEGKVVNEFEVKVGAVPFLSEFVPFATYSGGLPFTIDGAIVSTADATQTTPDEWELYMDTVEIKGSNIPLLRNVLDSGNVKLRSRDLSDFLKENVDAYETPRPVLRTTYLDDSMRIVRDEDENVFVYGRVSESEEPTDYSGVLADLGVASLLEGFNDAIAKIYL